MKPFLAGLLLGALASSASAQDPRFQVGLSAGWYETAADSRMYRELAAGYFSGPRTTYTLYQKSLFGFSSPDYWRAGAHREAALLAAQHRLSLSYIAGVSIANGERKNQLSIDGGLRARYPVFSWLSLETAWTNFFYSDSVFTEGLTGICFDRAVLKGLSISVLYPVFLYTEYPVSSIMVTKTKMGFRIRYTF